MQKNHITPTLMSPDETNKCKKIHPTAIIFKQELNCEMELYKTWFSNFYDVLRNLHVLNTWKRNLENSENFDLFLAGFDRKYKLKMYPVIKNIIKYFDSNNT